jgi:hypothetical protein
MRSILRRIAVLVAAIGLLAEAPAQQEAERTFAASGARIATIRSYTSAVHVDFALRSFPYLKFHLEGHMAWARPNDYSVHFDHVPWFGKGFEHMKADALEPATWPEHYDVTAFSRKGDRTLVEMRDKTTGNIRSVHAELDEDGLRRIVWQYVNGGKIDVTITPHLVDGVPVPVEEDAEIKLPAYHVVAHATFSDYHIVNDGR